MSKTRDPSLHEDSQDDISNNGFDDEGFSSFLPQMCNQLSEEEIALRNEMKLLKQAKKLLSDLNQELVSQRVKPESQTKSSRTTEQAKEEAMKLLKSGAISFDTGNERHVFKRKLKESEGGDSEDISEPGKGRKPSLYDNFVAGERVNPTISPTNKQKPSTPLHDAPQDSRNDFGKRMSLHKPGLPDFEGEGRRPTGGSTIYISFNDINEANVREILEPYGPILNIRVDEKKCYGFVTLKSPDMAEKALMLDRTRYNNHRLRVNYARRQHRAHDVNFEDNLERSSPRPIPRESLQLSSVLTFDSKCESFIYTFTTWH